VTIENLITYLTGRAGRSEYWRWIVVITVGTVLGGAIYRNTLFWSAVSALPWFVIAPRRLRDFGASPWWCLFTLASGFAIGLFLGFFKGLLGNPLGDIALFRNLLIGLVNWGFIIYLGVRRGLPPKSEKLAEVF
jgi:uncharacterized membrane protein YhaH (DUF805 family)